MIKWNNFSIFFREERKNLKSRWKIIITWKWRTIVSSRGHIAGNRLNASSPNVPPKPILMVFNDINAGSKALKDMVEKPHPKSISSNLHIFLNSACSSSCKEEKLDSLFSVQLSTGNKFLQSLAFKYFKLGFPWITWANAAPEICNFTHTGGERKEKEMIKSSKKMQW